MFISNYKQFEQNQPLMLPPHIPYNEPNSSILFMKDLVKLYPAPHILANKINSFCENGIYLTIEDLNSGLYLISQQEPLIIFGVEQGREITIGPYNGVKVDEDSIVIYSKYDESIYFLSLKDDYKLTFTKPNTQKSIIDPYGEEDWD